MVNGNFLELNMRDIDVMKILMVNLNLENLKNILNNYLLFFFVLVLTVLQVAEGFNELSSAIKFKYLLV